MSRSELKREVAHNEALLSRIDRNVRAGVRWVRRSSISGRQNRFCGCGTGFWILLLAMVYTIGSISGCHINPAVTVGLLLTRKFEAKYVPGYIIAQIIGAILAAGVLLVVARGTNAGYDPSVGGFAANGYGTHSPGGYNLVASFVTEVVLTLFLVFTVLGSTDLKAPVGFAGIPIGIVLALIHLVGIPVTNTSVNPARSIGPALFVGGWALQQLWLFIVAPLIGAALASVCYEAIRISEPVIPARVAEAALPSEQLERAR